LPGPSAAQPHNIPLKQWPRDWLVAATTAYRLAMGQGHRDAAALLCAVEALLAAGYPPAEAVATARVMVAAVSAQHAEWFWAPAKAMEARREAYWRQRGTWPPPSDPARWPAELWPPEPEGGAEAALHALRGG
jgi:hypothetical protein